MADGMVRALGRLCQNWIRAIFGFDLAHDYWHDLTFINDMTSNQPDMACNSLNSIMSSSRHDMQFMIGAFE